MIRRVLPLVVFALLAVLLAVGVRMNSGRDTSAIPSPLIGKPVPRFDLPVLGEPARRASDRDLLGRATLVNVWGSWCPTCRDEQPQLEALARTRRVRMVGYNYKDEPADAQRWLQQFGNPFELVIADQDGQAALDWGIYGAPETFLLDAKGIVRWKLVGPITDEVLNEQLLPAIAALERAP